ncbi:MAG: hypothetical protein UW44_C0015G0048 [Candidatus Collierbacteria bacterium GW2011_GWB2_44_22]|uniref:Uncharacterized protein n=1 Tax=Candidatus Collierbacteria bacterium GW2011_GWB2_44_22 TaxID=1618387 RepID=A0A0G1K4I6_9BACT|nr:MAG: hypothetical protein UW44_C0015G0048 [Candidatus Collierbacteria bacterium GW2011_GWB2_44_22]
MEGEKTKKPPIGGLNSKLSVFYASVRVSKSTPISWVAGFEAIRHKFLNIKELYHVISPKSAWGRIISWKSDLNHPGKNY